MRIFEELIMGYDCQILYMEIGFYLFFLYIG